MGSGDSADLDKMVIKPLRHGGRGGPTKAFAETELQELLAREM